MTNSATEDDAYEWYRELSAAVPFETEHPVVRVHPVTGEHTLLLGDFADRIVGYARKHSDLLMELLQSYVTRLENTVRWSWQAGDVAIWDNQATQHRAIGDFGKVTRILHRTTVNGTVPVGVDGTHSRSIKPAVSR